MRIVEVTENKKQYLDLLLLADEQEDMVDRYLYKSKMYVLDDDMEKDFSWGSSALQYQGMYDWILRGMQE